MFKRYLLQVILLAIIIIASLQLISFNSQTDENQLALPTLMPFPDEIVADSSDSGDVTNTLIPEPENIILATPVPLVVSLDAGQTSNVIVNTNENADEIVTTSEPVTPPLPSTISITPQQNLHYINQIVSSEAVVGQIVIRFASSVSAQDRADYIASIGGTIEQTVDALNSIVVTMPDQVVELPKSNLVVESEPDYYVSALVDIASPPSDPYYAEQWALPVIGAPEAWAELPDDAPQVTVAVIDSGVCLDHPDLVGRILAGYDFVEDDATPQDELGHGCGVAGIIAANIDNGIGIAGVAPNALVMPVRVLDATGIGTYSDVSAGIVYAVDNGAEIINLSLGGVNHSTLLEAAVNYAVGQGVIVVAAAGNTGGAVLYPAKYEPVIAVGSLDQDLQPSSFSANGAEVDVWAPGHNILMPTISNGYSYFNGTSFATPLISAELALSPQSDTVDLAPEIPDPNETAVPNDTDTHSLTGWLTILHGDPEPDSGGVPILEVRLTSSDGSTITKLNLDYAQASPFENQQVEILTHVSVNNLQADTVINVLDIVPIGNTVEAELFGSKPFINVFCRFSDIATEPLQPNEYDPLFANAEPGLDHYWRQVSYNNIDIAGTTSVSQWVELPQPRSYYVDDVANVADLDQLAEDCAAAADALVVFPNFFGVNFFFNEDLDCCAWGGGKLLTIDGQSKVYRTTWLPPWAHRYDILAHEMGHAFGLPHSSGPADNPPAGLSIYVSQWDVMSASSGTCSMFDFAFQCWAPGTIGYHIDLDEWIPSSRKVIIDTVSVQTVTIERLHQPVSSTNPLLAIVEISPGHFYTVETRFNNVGYDRNIPSSGIIIHDVLIGRPGNTGPSLLVDAADGNDNVNDAGGVWTVGETYADTTNNITISILSAGTSSFTVEIDKGNEYVPPEPSQEEVDALVALYTSTNGDNWSNNTGWLTDSSACTWYGVFCDIDGHVTNLDLSFNNLNGTLPTEVGDLINLAILEINDNQLDGSIPASITTLTDLISFNIRNNQLTGSIPVGFSNTRLQSFDVTNNQLTGNIPADLATIVDLTYFSVFNNQLTGSIPIGFGNASNLWLFSVALNQLDGTIPSDLASLTQLNYLDMSDNDLTGSIPVGFGNALDLWYFGLGSNQLTGNIPADLGNATSLDTLNLVDNQLIGSIPPELSNLTNLQYLNLGSNQLSGTIPSELGDLSNLLQLLLWSNQLTGNIPPELGNLTNLQGLHLYDNQLSGSIPPELGNLTNLSTLFLANTQLMGSIPPELGNLSNLQSLYLYNNELSGSIPTQLGNLTNLQYLYLNNNQLTGSIPSEIGNLSSLSFLNLRTNQLSDHMPPELGNLSNLQFLSLSQNKLTGSIPPELGNLSNLLYLYLDVNKLNGSIPPEFGNLTNLTSMDLSDNALVGKIPQSITNLTNLNLELYDYTDLGFNSLYSTDANLVAFLNDKDPDWANTQTIAPANVQVIASTSISLTVGWDAIPYTADGGYYEVLLSETSGEPYEITGCTTADKTETSCEATGLTENTDYFMIVRTFTPAHGIQQNDLSSGFSAEISTSPSTSDDLGALVALYNSTNGDNWTNNIGWLIDEDVCIWFGITCDVNGNITHVDLPGNNLVGTIPADLGSALNLQYLNLPFNQLTGPIPNELTNLSNLTSFNLFGNQLNGSIPTGFGSLTNMELFNIGSNQLTGTIPTDLGDLPQLTFLQLGGNSMNGTIPASLGNLINLQGINLSANQFTGTIPTEFGNLTSLSELILNDNQLSGEIPTELGNLTNLGYLYLSNNKLSGQIPTELGNLTNLYILDLSRNAFESEIPQTITNLVNLNTNPFDVVDFGYNRLSSTDATVIAFLDDKDPDWVDTQTIAPENIQIINSTSSGFTVAWDAIPYTAGSGYYEVLLTQISGEPYELVGCTTSNKTDTSCEVTDLTSNTEYFIVVRTFTPAHDIQQNDLLSDFSNEISASTSTSTPDDYNALVALYNSTDGDNWINNTGWLIDADVCVWYGISCDLNGNVFGIGLWSNNLVGTIPDEIGNLNNLIGLNLADNGLTGSLPTSIGNLTNLQGLLLERNNLTGNIPPEIGNLTNVQYLILNANNLSGNIPTEIGSLTQLFDLNLGENNLSGNVPVSIGNLVNLNILNLAINSFDGEIPTSLQNLTNLYSLYLDGNNFTGNIPLELTTLQNLQELGLYGNQLTGSIPPEIANMTNLARLILGNNQFTGTIPSELGNLTSLSYLALGNNQLVGAIPPEIWSLDLGYLDLSDNSFTGSIPPAVGNLLRLNWLDLSGNLLSGSIPTELGNLNQNFGLRTLDLSNNALSGEIPSSLTNLTQLNLQNYSTGFTDIGFNSLYSADATVIAFLNDKDPDWADTQTIAPENIQIIETTASSLTIAWDAIPYTADGGYYEVLLTQISGEPYEVLGCTTSNKTETFCEVTGLTSNTEYFMVVRTLTPAHDTQQNDLLSEYSDEVNVTTNVFIARGDCNADTFIDAGDLSAIQLEIFDGDSASVLDDMGGGFAGDPIGCDSNADSIIDAGDLSCTQRIIFDENYVCSVQPD